MTQNLKLFSFSADYAAALTIWSSPKRNSLIANNILEASGAVHNMYVQADLWRKF